MKKFNQSFILFFVLLNILNCACNTKNINSTTNQFENIYIIQNSKEVLVKDKMSIQLEKDEFSFDFFNKRYNPSEKKSYTAKVAFSLNQDEFENYKIGYLLSNIPYFETGSGMAPNKSGFYESIFINEDAHNYLFYKNEQECRLILIEETANNLLKLRFEVKKFYLNGKETEIRKSNLNNLYVAILIDRNLNGKIDKNELKRLSITFQN